MFVIYLSIYCSFQGPWTEVPAVGLYCMELECQSNNEYSILKRINLYPWIRWNPHFSDRVMNIHPDTELCHSTVVESLPRDIPCLNLSDIGIMCDIPAISKHLTDVSLDQNVSLPDDNILNRHAAASHLEAADGLLSVLSDAVDLRVMYQDARCHICLLQQRSTDATCKTEGDVCHLAVLQSSITSVDSPVELISGNSAVSFARESQSNSSFGWTYESGLHDGTVQCSSEMAGCAPSSCSDSSCHAFTQQLQCRSSSDTSIGQVS